MEKIKVVAKYLIILVLNIGWPMLIGFGIFLLIAGGDPSYFGPIGQVSVSILSKNPTILLPLIAFLPNAITLIFGIWKYYKTSNIKSSLFYLIVPIIPVIIYVLAIG